MSEKKILQLRLDKKLFDELQRLAEADFRSVNGEIEFALDEFIRKRRFEFKVRQISDDEDEDEE
ncbi:MAG: PTS ascorbate transporter subunit IIC [Fimbriimonadaceae bacterium]|nr:PTS ascorbate transporter subunit IIC [Fimbriimonadaceae bacterium]